MATVTIANDKAPSGITVINEADYDEKEHKKATAAQIKKAQEHAAKRAKKS